MMLQSKLLALPGIRHGFFTRQGGVSTGFYASLNGGLGSQDDKANVAENRSRMAAALGVDARSLLSAHQTHSTDVAIVESPWTVATRPRADAIVTRVANLAIGVTSADCGPVLLADPHARVIGAVHAGWRGALAGVVEASVKAMERLGAERNRICAALGPMIRQGNYEVGPDFIKKFAAMDRNSGAFFVPAPREQHAMFDLAGYIAARLRRSGIGQVDDLRSCTYADPGRFFSFRRSTHRAEADYGRHVNAIVLG